MDSKVPTSTAGWLFLMVIAGLMLGGSSLVLINEIQQVLATHEYILTDLPDKIDHIDKNVIRICSSLDVDCVP